jgi:hypothetical protein
MASVVLGYTCICGERVKVFHLEPGAANQLPRTVIVSCSNGHTATFNSRQVGLLELWTGDPAASQEQTEIDYDEGAKAA